MVKIPYYNIFHSYDQKDPISITPLLTIMADGNFLLYSLIFFMRLKWNWLWSVTACAKIKQIPFHTCRCAQTDMVILIYDSVFFFPLTATWFIRLLSWNIEGQIIITLFNRREINVRSWSPRPTDLIEPGIRGSENANANGVLYFKRR